MVQHVLCVVTLFALALTQFPAGSETPEEAAEAPLLIEDFSGGLGRWKMTDDKAWEVGEEEGSKVLVLKGGSDYEPPVRSPLNIALLKDFSVTDFVADFQAKQTGREYGHRDLCFFFGYQDPSHFYYVHIASVADAHANSIFLVNGAARVSIAKERTEGTAWSNGYHHIRVKRDTQSGRIEVFFDDMEKPVMLAEDKTFVQGSIGIGSFDDEGVFRRIEIRGTIFPGEAPAPAL